MSQSPKHYQGKEVTPIGPNTVIGYLSDPDRTPVRWAHLTIPAAEALLIGLKACTAVLLPEGVWAVDPNLFQDPTEWCDCGNYCGDVSYKGWDDEPCCALCYDYDHGLWERDNPPPSREEIRDRRSEARGERERDEGVSSARHRLTVDD